MNMKCSQNVPKIYSFAAGACMKTPLHYAFLCLM